MGSKTGIEWTDATWNPIIGCSRVSEGCRNCYAEGIAGRFGQGKPTVYSGLTQIVNGRAVWTGQIAETKQLLQPLSWRKPKRVFVNSMSDLFHENVTDAQRDRIFAVMALCPRHTFQVLTKRPERMRSYFSGLQRVADEWASKINKPFSPSDVLNLRWMHERLGRGPAFPYGPWPLPNVWLGVSVENQKTADERIPQLLITPAAVRFLSCEPVLGEIDLWTFLYTGVSGSRFNRLHWVICGGESGHGARVMHPDWPRKLRDQCRKAEVPYFFKQHGEWLSLVDYDHFVHGIDASKHPHQFAWRTGAQNKAELPISCYRVGKKAAGALLDGREWKEFPR